MEQKPFSIRRGIGQLLVVATFGVVKAQQASAADPQCASPCLGSTCGKFSILLTCSQISDRLRCNCFGCCSDRLGTIQPAAHQSPVTTPGALPTPAQQAPTSEWLMPGSGSNSGPGAAAFTASLYSPGVTLNSAQGACKKSTGDMMPLHEDWSVPNAASCQKLCAAEPLCNGFQFAEFRASGVATAYTACKLFTELATHVLPLSGHVCFYKASAGISTTVAAIAKAVRPATGPVPQTTGPAPSCLQLIHPYTDFSQHNCLDLRSMDLSYADLTGAKMYNVDISFSNFAYASFFRADFGGLQSEDTIFQGANLTQSILQGCEFEKGNFEEASLAGADARGSKFIDCSLSGAQLTAVTLQDTVLFKTSFRGATLNYAQLRGSEAETVDFSNANLVGADFTSAKLFESSFKNAVLHGAVFRDAWLEKADFTGATGLESATFTGSSGSPVGLAFNFPKTTSTPPIG